MGRHEVRYCGAFGEGAQCDGVGVVAEDGLQDGACGHVAKCARSAGLVDEDVGADGQLLDFGDVAFWTLGNMTRAGTGRTWYCDPSNGIDWGGPQASLGDSPDSRGHAVVADWRHDSTAY